MPRAKTNDRLKQITLAVIAVLCVVISLWLAWNRQYVVDQISVWQYTPSQQVIALADRSSMNDTGRFYFYTSHPSIESSASFNDKCDRKEMSTAILGCYDGRYIYIYNVTDPKLDGIQEVTAAHEMLHAAYIRLSEEKKQEINKLLEAEYEKMKGDEKLEERMEFYARTEPGERENELHSIIGTEVAVISSELEAYYQTYFSDRSRVVALYEKYAGVFLQLQAQSDELVSQLSRLGDKIEQETLDYNKVIAQFNADVTRFEARIDSGDFTSEVEYTRERSALQQRAQALDAKRVAINTDISEYEQLRAELQGIASESEALNRSIDSSLAPAPSL